MLIGFSSCHPDPSHIYALKNYKLILIVLSFMDCKTKIKLLIAKIRGIESHGMLCSSYELDQSTDKEGIIELNKKEKNIGDKYFKNTGERTMDIAITPNRPDCLGVRGIARDLASSDLGQLKKLPTIKIKQNLASFVKRKYKVKNGEAIYENGLVKFKGKSFRFNSLIKEAYLNRVSLSSSGFYATPKIHFDKNAFLGDHSFIFVMVQQFLKY